MEPNPYKIIFDIIFACTGLIGSMMVLGISLFLTFDGSWDGDLWGQYALHRPEQLPYFLCCNLFDWNYSNPDPC